MAWTEFYVQNTASNTNAGSTNSDSPAASVTNGNWNATSRVYTAPSGTPFASISVGDWAAIYNDGAATTPYIGEITAKTDTTITISATKIFGVAPTTSATGRSCKVGGAWASLVTLAGFATNISLTAAAINMRVNLKGTHSHTTTSISLSGWTITPANLFWLRGYTTTPGDLDDEIAAAKPTVTFTTGLFTFSMAGGLMSSIDISGARTTGQQLTLGAGAWIDNCLIQNTNAGASSSAVVITGNGAILTRSHLKATSTASFIVSSSINNSILYGNLLEGGGSGFSTSSSFICAFNVFKDCGSHGIVTTSTPIHCVVLHNTFYSCADAIRITAVPANTQIRLIAGNNITDSSANGINNTANTGTGIPAIGNLFANNAANKSGVLDAIFFKDLIDVPSSVVSSTDLTIVSTSNGYATQTEIPGDDGMISYADVGAVHAEPPSGGSGGSLIGSKTIIG